MADSKTIILSGNGGEAIVSEKDFERVTKYNWSDWGGYAFCPALKMSLHKFIMGDRPHDISSDYVIDHIDRNKRNDHFKNLRWVSASFNSFNAIQINRTKSSRFRGVQLVKKTMINE